MGAEVLEYLVYFDPLPEGFEGKRLPGIALEKYIDGLSDQAKARMLASKLEHCCRKLIMMCLAVARAKAAEREFYSETIKESPALFG